MDTALMDPVERLRAALADRYEIDREIGRGGLVSVYQPGDPNLPPLQDSGSADGPLDDVMTLVEGETLLQLPTASFSGCSSRTIHGRESTLGRSPFQRPAALHAAAQGAQWVPP
jgi:hypothetical protein